MTKKTIVDKCIAWNEARYPQVYNKELATSLIREELNELREAQTVVDELDAIGDITFVAIGTLWKLGCSNEVLNKIFYGRDLTTISLPELENHVYSIENRLNFSGTDKEGSDKALYAVFGTCFNKLVELDMQQYFYRIVDAICVSNNTKVLAGKTAPSIKVAIDKGPAFVPPTEALMQIIADAKLRG